MIPDVRNTAQPDGLKSVILVVDDDPNNLAVLQDCLVELNYTILVAEDGESAVQRADYARPDLILLDVMMPGINGYETCRQLKSRTGTKDIPVIFMTALAETGNKIIGFEAGAIDYITKPFQREELLARITVHLQNRELTRKLQEAKEQLEIMVEKRTKDLAQTIDSLYDGEEERVRLATAIEQADEAIFMSDNHWNITYVNPAFEHMSGYTRDAVLGQSTTILRWDTLDPEHYDQVRGIIMRNHSWSGRISTRKHDGSVFMAKTTVSSVRDLRGAIINYVFILQDVTNELRLEQQLRQSQKMEAIGTLAGGIAHDFNNILTAIIGHSDLAQRKILKGEVPSHNLEQVLRASLRAQDLVNRILTFCRQGEQERKQVQIASIIDEALKLLRSTMPATIEIHQHIDTSPDGDTILGDPTQILQVLMNLGTNAAHAMRAKGGEFSIFLADFDVDGSLGAVYPDLTPGPFVRLTVSDTGHGIEPAVKERIFDPYFTTKKVGEGTGMGLAVVQGIVKSHGGTISVFSEPGGGTVFHIFLPKFTGVIEHLTVKDELPTGGGERILFVDDETMLADLGQTLLESLGYEVTVTSNSREALNLFHSAPQNFDLIITDMTMPGLTGKDLAREFLAVRPDIPIILCTGFSELINESKAKEMGIRDFIMKPYSLNILDKSIRKVLT